MNESFKLMDKISKNISYKEAIHSATAKRRDIDNSPDSEQVAAMLSIAEMIFQPLREWVGGPIKINSFFRSEHLNAAIGGSLKSQHCLGQAMDLDDSYVDVQENRNRCLKAYKKKGKTKYAVI